MSKWGESPRQASQHRGGRHTRKAAAGLFTGADARQVGKLSAPSPSCVKNIKLIKLS